MNYSLEKEDLAALSTAFAGDRHLVKFVNDLESAYVVLTCEEALVDVLRISDFWVTGRTHTIVRKLSEGRFHFVRFFILDHYEHHTSAFSQQIAVTIQDFAILTIFEEQNVISKVLRSDVGKPVRFSSRFFFLNNMVQATVELELRNLLEMHHQDLGNVASAIDLTNYVIVGGA